MCMHRRVQEPALTRLGGFVQTLTYLQVFLGFLSVAEASWCSSRTNDGNRTPTLVLLSVGRTAGTSHSTTFSSLTDKPFQFWTRRANFPGILNSVGGGVQPSREGELHKLYTLGALAHFTGVIAKTRLHSSVNNNVWRDAARLLPKDPHGVCLLLTCLDFRWACRGLWRLSWKQANAAARTNKERRGGGMTPHARSLGLNANPSTFVVLLQMLRIHTHALLPPTHPELF